MALQIGESLGRYRLEALVGQGGMAVVYRAVDAVLGRTVAVKVIRPAYTEDPQFLDRFLQEARVVASLDHPNILPLFDFGEQAGAPYLVLPYLPGGSLADRMSSKPQPLALVVAWAIQLAGALDAAHGRGVLHRDIKPGNVLIGKDGRLVLGDFGIARLAEATTRLTATGMVVGTPVYMAPELARGNDASPASDRYALAVMIYEMFAGRPPFIGQNPLSILHQQVHDPPPNLVERLPDLPAGVDGFFARALAKDPAARPLSARVMAEELVQLLSPGQRAELSTLVWSGSPDVISGSHPEAPTVVDSGRTLHLGGPTEVTAARGVGSAATMRRVSPLYWALAASAVLAGALLFLQLRHRVAEPSPPVAAAAPSPTPIKAIEVTPTPTVAPTSPPAPTPSGSTLAASSLSTSTLPTPSPTGTRPSAGAAAGRRAIQKAAPPLASRPGPAPTAIPAATATPSPPPTPTAVPSAAPQPVEEPAAAESGDSALPQDAVRRGKFEILHRPVRRMSVADFQRVLADTDAIDADPRAIRMGVNAFREWARGGLGYAAGKVDEANARRDELLRGNAPWGVAWPAVVFRDGKPWDLAAVYADVKGDLSRQIEPLLPTPADPRAALAAAYLAHLKGQHELAIRRILATGFDPTRANEPGRALLAQFLAAEAVESGDGPAVRRWLPYALNGGRAPLAKAFIAEVALLARNFLGAQEAMELRRQGCEIGVAFLCGKGQQPPGPGLNGRFLGRRRPGPGGATRGNGGGPGNGGLRRHA